MSKIQKKPLLVYFNNYPAPYVVDRLNALVESNEVNVEAWFLYDKSERNGWIDGNKNKWKFKYKFYKNSPIFFTDNLSKPDILISLYHHPIFIINIFFYKLFRTKIFLHSVKTFDAWNKRTIFKNMLKYFLFNLVTGFHANGKDAKNQIKKFLIFKKKFILVPWNINLAWTFGKIPKIKYPKKKLNFLFTGRIIKIKGLDLLIDSFDEIKKRNKNFQLKIVGDGNYLEELKKKVNKKNLNKFIKFFKKQPSKLLCKFYSENDIFIFPTTGDPYGIVIDEALSFNLPIICSNQVGEIDKRVINGFNGKIFKSGSKKDLVNSILAYYKTPKILSLQSKKCINKIPKNYNFEYVKKIIKLIKGK